MTPFSCPVRGVTAWKRPEFGLYSLSRLPVASHW
jgi:hypothetical protein